MLVYDSDGNELGDVPLSEKQAAALEASGNLAVLYHTPQLMRGSLPQVSGSFQLRKDGERIVTSTEGALKEFLTMYAAIKAAREA